MLIEEEGGSHTMNALPLQGSLLWIKNEAAAERVRAIWHSTGMWLDVITTLTYYNYAYVRIYIFI
jgi:hypothetical protein